jgi:methionyl aminopeptidase
MFRLKSNREIEKIRISSRIVAQSLELVEGMIEPGLKTIELDRAVKKFIESEGGVSAFYGYRRGNRVFPAHICVSINDEVVHGIPNERVLVAGDLVSVDIGVEKDGYIGDAARTFAVGEVSEAASRLMEATSLALEAGIANSRQENRLFDISRAVQETAESSGFSVVREYTGHGVGVKMHEEPQIPNYVWDGPNTRLQVGMVLAIEPMVNAGGFQTVVLPDEWTVVTADGSLSAHFENTVAITETGPDILTSL